MNRSWIIIEDDGEHLERVPSFLSLVSSGHSGLTSLQAHGPSHSLWTNSISESHQQQTDTRRMKGPSQRTLTLYERSNAHPLQTILAEGEEAKGTQAARTQAPGLRSPLDSNTTALDNAPLPQDRSSRRATARAPCSMRCGLILRRPIPDLSADGSVPLPEVRLQSSSNPNPSALMQRRSAIVVGSD